MRVSARAKAASVARVRSGQATIADEARRLGVDERSVRRYLEAAPAPGSEAAQAAPGAVGTPAVPEDNPRLEEVLREAGDATAAPSPAAAAAAALEDDRRLALESIRGIKAVAVSGLALLYNVPLEDGVITKAAALSAQAEMMIVANATYLADLMRRNVGGPYLLAAVLAFDGILAWSLVSRRGRALNPRREPENDQAAPKGPAAPEPGPV